VIIWVTAVCLTVAGQLASAQVTLTRVDSLVRVYPDRPSPAVAARVEEDII